MIAQPVPAYQELTHDLNAYFARGRKLTAFEIKAVEKKATSLKNKIGYAEYHVFLGFIAALRRDSESLTYHFENALKLEPSDITIMSNYIIALRNSGWYLQALAQGRRLAKKLNNGDSLLAEIIEPAFFLGRFHEAYDFWVKLEKPQQNQGYQAIIDAIEIIDHAQLNGDDAERLQQLAFSVIQKRNLYFSGAKMSIARGCIHYEIFVDLPIEEIFDVNWELTDVLVENTHNKYNDVLMFEYSSIDVLDERRAS